MAQEPYDNNDGDTEEYHFNDDDSVAYEPQEEQANEMKSGFAETLAIAKGKINKQRFIAVVLGIIFSLFILYKLSSMLFGSKKEISKVVPPKAAVTSVSSSKQSFNNKESTFPSSGVSKTVLAQESNAFTASGEKEQSNLGNNTQTDGDLLNSSKTNKNHFENLKDENERLVTRLENQQLQSREKMNSLENKVTNLGGNLTSLRSAIYGLTDQLRTNEVKQKTLNEYKKRVHKTQEQTVRHIKRYFVKAVIPGRAWLVGADGSALTVSVGNEVPGYGKVIGINSYDGTLTTSSGFKIYYGASDR